MLSSTTSIGRNLPNISRQKQTVNFDMDNGQKKIPSSSEHEIDIWKVSSAQRQKSLQSRLIWKTVCRAY